MDIASVDLIGVPDIQDGDIIQHFTGIMASDGKVHGLAHDVA